MVELKGKDLIISRLKVIKNSTEVDGLRGAYLRESASLISVYAEMKRLIEETGGFKEYEVEGMLDVSRKSYSG